MATTKKYVSLEKLGLYDEKIKAKIAADDATTLAAAKTYADGLAVNYDAAGAANTALNTAKGYTDTEVAKANGAAATAQAAAEAADAKAVAADGKAVAAQGEVDALETYVGTFTHDTAKTVVEYINAKTDGIATSGNLEALGTRVTTVEGKIATIEENYLDGADKTELEGKIADAVAAVATEKARAEEIESGLRTDIDAIAEDYLTSDDKTELADDIAEVAGAVERLTNGVSTEEIDGVNDLIAYVNEHGTTVKGMQDDIAENAAAIAAEAERAKGVEATNAAAAAAAKTAADNAQAAAETAQAAADAEAARAADVEGGLDTRLTAVEAQLGDGEGSVSEQIADAKAELQGEIATAIEGAKTDASNKDAVVLAEAQKGITAVQTALDTHTGNADIHVTAEQKTAWTTAAGKAHEHSNLEVLEGITAAKVTEWDKVTAKADATALQAEIERATAAEQANAAAIAAFVEVSEQEILDLFK